MTKYKVLALLFFAGIMTVIADFAAYFLVKYGMYEEGDLSTDVSKMTEKEIAKTVKDMTDQEFFEYMELIKSNTQKKRVLKIREIIDDVDEWEILDL